MDVDNEQYRRLLGENTHLRQQLNQATGRLEDLENTVGAIREGLIDAVVVYQDRTPQVWCLEPADRLRLRLMLQTAKAGTWDWDIEQGVVTWSDGIARIFGLEDSDVGEQRGAITSSIYEDDRERVLANLQGACADGRGFYDEFRVLDEDGSIRWLAARGQLVRGASGEPMRLLGIHLDITERRRIEEQLRKEEHNKNSFLATLAHELRNPFAAIANAVQLSRANDLDQDRRSWTEEVIDRQMQQVGRLMDDLLDLSRIAQGKVELRSKPVVLADVIDDAVRSVRSLYEKGAYTLTVTGTTGSLWVQADAVRLGQVFANVLTNAARYNRPRGNVVLTLANEGNEAVVSVRDTGVGIAPEMLPHVFNLFVQGTPTSTSERGLGIGLALVRSIVELHGGTVEARSAGLGMGAEFIVRLPLVTPPGAEAEGQHTSKPDHSAFHILIVDDNEDAAETLSFLLAHAGHHAVYATTVERALEVADELHPQVALLDIGLPGTDGRQLGAQLLRSNPEICLIAVSGYGGEGEREASKVAGFHEHLVKPVMLDDILDAIESARIAQSH
jgi:PAS domain S-box-containing protein